MSAKSETTSAKPFLDRVAEGVVVCDGAMGTMLYARGVFVNRCFDELNLRVSEPYGHGIALHLGEVFYGNIGAHERLDFTVIGRTVNEACRIESLSKVLGEQLLLSKPFAEAWGGTVRSLGVHTLRGVSEPQELFSA